MAFKTDSSDREAMSEINVTPLVDVVLVLLIIFMVVTPMLSRGVKVDLPETTNHEKKHDTGEQIIALMRKMQHEQLVSFIFASHDPQLISHAEETFVIRDGKLVEHRKEGA